MIRMGKSPTGSFAEAIEALRAEVHAVERREREARAEVRGLASHTLERHLASLDENHRPSLSDRHVLPPLLRLSCFHHAGRVRPSRCWLGADAVREEHPSQVG